MSMKLIQGDCLEVMKALPDNSVDSCVTDPPYGLKFMGKKWDYNVPTVEQWKEVYRVMKPGAFLLSFGGTRTYHRMVVNIEDAGFEIRDQIQWLYGSGFPKSLDVGKAVDKLQGNERETIGPSKYNARRPNPPISEIHKQGGYQETVTKGQSDFEGFGTALKPANEPICLARKPLSEKTVAANVLRWGCGGLNIDKCRVMPYNDCVVGHNQKEAQDDNPESYRGSIGKENSKRNNNGDLPDLPERVQDLEKLPEAQKEPAHLFKGMPSKEHDGAEEFQLEGRSLGLQEDGIQPLEGGYTPGKRQETVIEPGCETSAGTQNDNGSTPNEAVEKNRNGSSYQRGQEGQPNRESLHIGLDKSRERTSENNERNGSSETGKRETQKTPTGRFPANVIHDGSDEVVGLLNKQSGDCKTGGKICRTDCGNSIFGKRQVNTTMNCDNVKGAARFFYCAKASKSERGEGNNHVTVKPLKLMCYLCRLVTPPGGTVLDCYVGSGTTGVAAQIEGFDFIGIDKDIRIATRRIEDTDPLFQAVGL